jgi:carbon monoxide dehydrogenase subunit G
MRLSHTHEIAAPRQAVWDWIADPGRYLHFMSGVTRWEIAGEQATGLGARYRMLMRVGSAEVGGLIEVVEFDAPAELAWTGVTGMDQRGRWRLREIDPMRTRVELRLSYGVAGSGIGGWLAEQASAPMVNAHLRRSLAQLERTLRHEELRKAAAARRRRTGAVSRI